MEKLNRLEMALLDPSNTQLDLYLEDESSVNIRKHIEEIQLKAFTSTDAGVLKKMILEVLNNEI